MTSPDPGVTGRCRSSRSSKIHWSSRNFGFIPEAPEEPRTEISHIPGHAHQAAARVPGTCAPRGRAGPLLRADHPGHRILLPRLSRLPRLRFSGVSTPVCPRSIFPGRRACTNTRRVQIIHVERPGSLRGYHDLTRKNAFIRPVHYIQSKDAPEQAISDQFVHAPVEVLHAPIDDQQGWSIWFVGMIRPMNGVGEHCLRRVLTGISDRFVSFEQWIELFHSVPAN